MKAIFRRLAFLLAFLLVVVLPLPVMAAGSAGISLNASTVTVGNTVKATFSFSGGDVYIAGVKAYVSYDSGKLKYTGASGDGDANVASGSGTIVLETSSTSKKNLSITLSFATQGTGDASIKITGSDIVDWDGNTVGAPTASKTVTIKEKEAVAPQPKPPEQETEKEEESVVEEPTDLETALPVEIDGDKLLLWTSLKNVRKPQGFGSKTIVYEGEQVEAAYHEVLGMTLLYTTNSEGANGAFFVYDGFDTFYRYKTLTVAENTYILMMPGEEVVFPLGYVQGEEVICEEAVTVWANPADAQYCCLYGAHETAAQPVLYLYDRQEVTMQRVNMAMYTLLIESEQTPEEEEVLEQEPLEEPIPAEEEKSVIDRILEDDSIMLVMIGVIGVSLLAVVIMMSVMIAGKKKRKAAQVVEQAAKEEAPEETTEEVAEEAAEETLMETAEEATETTMEEPAAQVEETPEQE